MEINDGGQAFPAVSYGEASETEYRGSYRMSFETVGGMSLRDWFAGQALVSGWREFLTDGDAWDSYEDFAASCYLMADAMLKAREGK